MRKQKKTKEPATCGVCEAWDGLAIPERDRGDKKFRCLDLKAPPGTRKRAGGVCWKIAATSPETAPESPPEQEVVQDQAPAETPATTSLVDTVALPDPVDPGFGDYIDLRADKMVFVLTSVDGETVAIEGDGPFDSPLMDIEAETYLSETDRPFIGSAEDEFGAERCFKCSDWIPSVAYCKKHKVEIRAEGTCVIGGFIASQK